jgi:hypothetical protein
MGREFDLTHSASVGAKRCTPRQCSDADFEWPRLIIGFVVVETFWINDDFTTAHGVLEQTRWSGLCLVFACGAVENAWMLECLSSSLVDRKELIGRMIKLLGLPEKTEVPECCISLIPRTRGVQTSNETHRSTHSLLSMSQIGNCDGKGFEGSLFFISRPPCSGHPRLIYYYNFKILKMYQILLK